MDDLELKEVLAVLAHQLKTQLVYLQGLHKDWVALYDVLKAADLEFESKYRRAMNQP